jgi:hypothetical protein
MSPFDFLEVHQAIPQYRHGPLNRVEDLAEFRERLGTGLHVRNLRITADCGQMADQAVRCPVHAPKLLQKLAFQILQGVLITAC